MEADWWYACTSLSGVGVRAAAVGEASFTMWPRKDGISSEPTFSVSEERGLANWPAMRPTFTTGTPME